MVDAISPITSTAASEPTKIGISTSIDAEPDNAWVAARQSEITADQWEFKRAAEKEAASDLIPHADLLVDDEEEAQKRRRHSASEDGEQAGEQAEPPLLSGESERIGTRNFDDDTPFGERTAII